MAEADSKVNADKESAANTAATPTSAATARPPAAWTRLHSAGNASAGNTAAPACTRLKFLKRYMGSISSVSAGTTGAGDDSKFLKSYMVSAGTTGAGDDSKFPCYMVSAGTTGAGDDTAHTPVGPSAIANRTGRAG